MNRSWSMSRGRPVTGPTSRPSGLRRRTTALVAVSTLVLSGLIAGSAGANVGTSKFEGNDANLIVNTSGNTDWLTVGGRALGVDISDRNADDAFGQGAKEDSATVTVVDGSIPPNKNNLSRFYEADEQLPNGNIMLYLAWERLVNIGNANLDFEINKNPTAGWTSATTGPITINRSAGDLLITYDFNGQGTPTLGLNRWVTTGSANQCYSANALPCWGNHVNLTGANSEGAVNSTTIQDTIGANNVVGGTGAPGSLGAGLFGEAAIDLTAAGVFQAGSCQAFGSAFVKSRSSTSFTAELKDFIAPVPISISNCSSIKVVKVTQNSPDANQNFTYTTTGTGLSDFSLKGGADTTFSTLSSGAYTVTEGSLPANWSLISLVCSGGANVTTSGATANINLNLGENVVCTYTNRYKSSPTITTSATSSVLVGGSISDTATLSGTSTDPAAGGSITFNLYTNNTCTGTPIATSTRQVTGDAQYTSDAYVTQAVTTYYWKATYSGDDYNNSATHACGIASEISTTSQHEPTLVTSATSSITIGGTIKDTATLSGGSSPTGTITFALYTDSSCTQPIAAYSSSVNVTGNGPYDSASYKPLLVGNYYWKATYSGDANNKSATHACGIASEISAVIQAAPAIVTKATASATIGESISDTATLSGAVDPIGNIVFQAWSNSDCDGTPAFTSGSIQVTGNGDYQSGAFTPTATGTYWWRAFYSGDVNNAAASGACRADNETSVVNKIQPGIVTAATASVTIDSAIKDVATLSGGYNPTGTITFTLYSDDQCLTEVAGAGSVRAVSGNGPYTSDEFTPTVVGTYYWIASYSGDSNNLPVSHACGAPGEVSTVNKAGATQTTAQTLRPQDSVDVTATAGGTPSGSVTFKLFATSDCSGTPAFQQTVTLVDGKAGTTNGTFTIDAASAGGYKWLVTYSGDAKHNGITGACGDENFTLAINNGGPVSSS